MHTHMGDFPKFGHILYVKASTELPVYVHTKLIVSLPEMRVYVHTVRISKASIKIWFLMVNKERQGT